MNRLNVEVKGFLFVLLFHTA